MTHLDAAAEVHDDTPSDRPNQCSTFEEACINLLSKQEHTLSTLSALHAQGRALESLDYAKQMIVAFLDFAESHFDQEHLNDVGRRLHDVYQQTKQHEKALLRRSFGTFKRMVGLKVSSDEEIHEAHQQLRRKYVELYSQFFAICVARFSDDSLGKEEFLQGVEAFIGELDGKW